MRYIPPLYFPDPNNKVKVWDSFDRPDNASVIGRSLTGQVWQALRGTWGTKTGKLYRSADAQQGGLQLAAAIESGISDNCNITVTLSVVSTESRVIFRVLDAGNHYQLKGSGTAYVLRKVVGGVITQIGSAYNVAPANGDEIQVRLQGNQITIFINNTQAFLATDATFKTSMHGVGSYGTTTESFDNFRVEAL